MKCVARYCNLMYYPGDFAAVPAEQKSITLQQWAKKFAYLIRGRQHPSKTEFSNGKEIYI